MTEPKSIRGREFSRFAELVVDHIENYTVPQYGDKGEDQCTNYSIDDCIKQAQKYLARYGRNAREGQEELDFKKAAHYIQMAYTMHHEKKERGE